MRSEFIHWSVPPEAFSIGPIQIRWYGLLFAAAFLCGYQIIWWVYREEHKPEKDLDRLFLFMFLGILLGARLGHCLFYEPGYFLSHPLEILKVWRGGLASHGAAIGVFVALYLYSRKHPDQPYLWLLSRMTLVMALGGSFVRLGNFFNSEIIGKSTDLPWAVVFTYIDLNPRHPAQLYESIGYLLVFLVLISIYRRHREKTNPNLLLGVFLLGLFSFRFLVEFTKEPQVAFEQSLSLNLGQWLSIPLALLGAYLLWLANKGKKSTSVEKTAVEHSE